MKRIKPAIGGTGPQVGAAEAAAFAAKSIAKHTNHTEAPMSTNIPLPLYADHDVTLHRTYTTKVEVVPNEEGNAQIVESGGEDIIAYLDSHLICTECGVLTDEDAISHGFSDEWCEA